MWAMNRSGAIVNSKANQCLSVYVRFSLNSRGHSSLRVFVVVSLGL